MRLTLGDRARAFAEVCPSRVEFGEGLHEFLLGFGWIASAKALLDFPVANDRNQVLWNATA